MKTFVRIISNMNLRMWNRKANRPQVVNFLKAVTNISAEGGSVPGIGC